MIEKVNPKHPDKLADRIAGAIVDESYKRQTNPRVAVEVLIGHGIALIINETTVKLDKKIVTEIVSEITKQNLEVEYLEVPQDEHLQKNQNEKIRCGDNGIFKGVPLTKEEKELSELSKTIYSKFNSDGKYILNDNKLIICQSYAKEEEIKELLKDESKEIIINPLGYWTGGTDVDAGATNRKLGSDMAQSVTGGGLHGKDLSKADVSVNIYAFLKAQETGEVQEFSCAIGDEYIDGRPYSEIVEIARNFIDSLGGFRAFAEWGLF